MRRICILGGSGAGKSTFCRRLTERLGYPAIHLDKLWWQPGWREPDLEDFLARLDVAMEPECWVMDGNGVRFIARRLAVTDTIIWLDYSTWICFWRVLGRIWHSHGTVRPDMGAGCPEKVDLAFLWFVLRFRRQYRPLLVKALEGWNGRLLHFKNHRETETWWASLG